MKDRRKSHFQLPDKRGSNLGQNNLIKTLSDKPLPSSDEVCMKEKGSTFRFRRFGYYNCYNKSSNKSSPDLYICFLDWFTL